MIDLHVHTTASDGTYTPAQAAALACELGLTALAVTDHDTVSGYAEAAAAGRELGIEVVPGIEISTKYGGAVHILGYYIDPESPALRPVLEWIVRDRDQRNRKIAELMAADGLPVRYEEMQQRFGQVIGRPHFAELLIELGLARDMQDAFDRYVDKGRKYYLPRSFLSPEQAIGYITAAGGVPVLAHPFQYKRDEKGLRELIEHCVAAGLRGMECRYSGYSESQCRALEALAAEYGLIRTGGSDFHGAAKPHIPLGGAQVPDAFLAELKIEAGKA